MGDLINLARINTPAGIYSTQSLYAGVPVGTREGSVAVNITLKHTWLALVRVSYEEPEKESSFMQLVGYYNIRVRLFVGSVFHHNQIGSSPEKRGFKGRTGLNTAYLPVRVPRGSPVLAQKGRYVLYYRAEKRTIFCD
jgi:hypothetical protein